MAYNDPHMTAWNIMAQVSHALTDALKAGRPFEMEDSQAGKDRVMRLRFPLACANFFDPPPTQDVTRPAVSAYKKARAEKAHAVAAINAAEAQVSRARTLLDVAAKAENEAHDALVKACSPSPIPGAA